MESMRHRPRTEHVAHGTPATEEEIRLPAATSRIAESESNAHLFAASNQTNLARNAQTQSVTGITQDGTVVILITVKSPGDAQNCDGPSNCMRGRDG